MPEIINRPALFQQFREAIIASGEARAALDRPRLEEAGIRASGLLASLYYDMLYDYSHRKISGTAQAGSTSLEFANATILKALTWIESGKLVAENVESSRPPERGKKPIVVTDDQEFAAYLRAVLKRLMVDFHRDAAGNIKPIARPGGFGEDSGREPPEPSDGQPTSSRQLSEQEKLAEIRRLLAAIKDDIGPVRWQMLVHRVLDEWPLRQIAREFDLDSSASARMRINRLRELIRCRYPEGADLLGD